MKIQVCMYVFMAKSLFNFILLCISTDTKLQNYLLMFHFEASIDIGFRK